MFHSSKMRRFALSLPEEEESLAQLGVLFVNGKEKRHPEGAYYLKWREGSKRVRLSVGKDPADTMRFIDNQVALA